MSGKSQPFSISSACSKAAQPAPPGLATAHSAAADMLLVHATAVGPPSIPAAVLSGLTGPSGLLSIGHPIPAGLPSAQAGPTVPVTQVASPAEAPPVKANPWFTCVIVRNGAGILDDPTLLPNPLLTQTEFFMAVFYDFNIAVGFYTAYYRIGAIHIVPAIPAPSSGSPINPIYVSSMAPTPKAPVENNKAPVDGLPVMDSNVSMDHNNPPSDACNIDPFLLAGDAMDTAGSKERPKVIVVNSENDPHLDQKHLFPDVVFLPHPNPHLLCAASTPPSFPTIVQPSAPLPASKKRCAPSRDDTPKALSTGTTVDSWPGTTGKKTKFNKGKAAEHECHHQIITTILTASLSSPITVVFPTSGLFGGNIAPGVAGPSQVVGPSVQAPSTLNFIDGSNYGSPDFSGSELEEVFTLMDNASSLSSLTEESDIEFETESETE
ncbi:hypothetical protein CPB84DRAFT_1750866 [Gymnopilus junonius]|uniref:Uncharacterized protein n=1 Tax=Gymnopilus junonius TaxID=109634 RepID=A0A9P5NCW6_GYMJU|nr:hypothetical protein CPB84DRAFT_1750866 [Gymnopilus junonius]